MYGPDHEPIARSLGQGILAPQPAPGGRAVALSPAGDVLLLEVTLPGP